MRRSDESETEEEKQIPVDLGVLDGNSVGTEEDHSHQFTLLGLEPILEYIYANAILDWRLCQVGEVGVLGTR